MLENSRTGVKIGMMHMPYRKKPCLVVDTTGGRSKYQNDPCVCKYASFNSELAASEFMMILAEFVNAKEVGEL